MNKTLTLFTLLTVSSLYSGCVPSKEPTAPVKYSHESGASHFDKAVKAASKAAQDHQGERLRTMSELPQRSSAPANLGSQKDSPQVAPKVTKDPSSRGKRRPNKDALRGADHHSDV